MTSDRGRTIPYSHHSHYHLDDLIRLQAVPCPLAPGSEKISHTYLMLEYRHRCSILQKPGWVVQVLGDNRTQSSFTNRHAYIFSCRDIQSGKLRRQRPEIPPLYNFFLCSMTPKCHGYWFVLVPEPKNTAWTSEHTELKFLFKHFNFCSFKELRKV